MILTPEEKTVLSESSEDTLTVIHNTELAVIAKMQAGCTYCASPLYAGITCPCCGRRSDPGEKNMAKWVVGVKGRAGSDSFEISVLRDDNEHGKRSYGWFDENKLLITHNGGPCRWPLTPLVWDKAVKLAHEVADGLNAAEIGRGTEI